jgi:hypothetical protein
MADGVCENELCGPVIIFQNVLSLRLPDVLVGEILQQHRQNYLHMYLRRKDLSMAPGTAYFSGRVSLVEAKKLPNGTDLARINLEMSIEGFDEAPPTTENIQLSVFGEKAMGLKRRLEQGDNFAMISAEVRCRPYTNKDGVTRAFPSFNVRSIVTERRSKPKAQDSDDLNDNIPF